MSREAMKLALEALVFAQYEDEDYDDACDQKVREARNALRQALEEEKQEPVAWRTFDGEGGYDYRSYEMNDTYDKEWAERNPNHKGWVEPLYTAPPKREWVGLTDDEFMAIAQKYSLPTRVGLEYFKDELEAKLQEKNHG